MNNDARLFLRFLKDKDLLSKYAKNYVAHPNMDNTQNILHDLEKAVIEVKKWNVNNPLNSSAIGFYWEESDEGINFWADAAKTIMF